PTLPSLPTHRSSDLVPQPAQPQAGVEVEAVGGHPAARWWAEHAAVDGGPAPGTVLLPVEPYGPGVRAAIASERPGAAVPDISIGDWKSTRLNSSHVT